MHEEQNKNTFGIQIGKGKKKFLTCPKAFIKR
jgi:hypothetical protein